MLRLEQKKQIVADLTAVAQNAFSIVAAEYNYLTASDMTILRARARSGEIYLQVVRNTLARKALVGTPYNCLSPLLKGQLVIAASSSDPGAPARLFRDFAKEKSDKLVVKAISLGGQLVAVSDLNAIADLPTKEKAIAMLMSVLQAPITKFVRTLAEPHTKLVRTFAALLNKKEQAV